MSRPPEVPPELGRPELDEAEIGGPEIGGPEIGGPELGGPEIGPGRDLVPVTPPPNPPEPGPGVLDLVARGARVGVDAASLLVTEVAEATVKAARAVLPPVVAEGPLDSVGEQVDRRRARAREREAASRDEAAEAMQAVIGRVVEAVIDQIDIGAIVGKVDIGEVIDQIDIAAIVDKIDIEEIVAGVDMGAIIRDSTSGLAGETVDAIRVQVMGIDLFVARVADKLLRRKTPRVTQLDGYDLYGSEIRVPKEMR